MSLRTTTRQSGRSKHPATPCRVLVGSQPMNPTPAACVSFLFSLTNFISANATNPATLANALYNSAGVVNTSYDSMGSSQLPNASLIQTNVPQTASFFANMAVSGWGSPTSLTSSSSPTLGGGITGGATMATTITSNSSNSSTTTGSGGGSPSWGAGSGQISAVAPSTLPLLAWGPNGLLAFACHAYIVVLHAPHPLTVLTTLDDHPTLITAIAWYTNCVSSEFSVSRTLTVAHRTGIEAHFSCSAFTHFRSGFL
jgi:hypothetical protein